MEGLPRVFDALTGVCTDPSHTVRLVEGEEPMCETCNVVHKMPEPEVRGWLAYYSDWSGMTFFTNEIDALRLAVDHGMKVMALTDGCEIR